MKEKTIVFSMDAMVGADIAYLKTKPNFSRLFKDRCEIGKVCTIYPSITYPAHMSIMTGCRPGKHGVITNLQKQYIEDGTRSKGKCPQCGQEQMAYQNGCLTCLSCGYSKCG